MSLLQGLLARAGAPDAACVARGESIADLRALRNPDCAAAIWDRRMPADVRDWLGARPAADLPRGRVTLRTADVPATLAHLCDLSGLAPGPARAWLEADIAALANAFSDMMAAPYLRLRLDVVTHDACRKFHIDALTARLICTYRGTGTQFGLSRDGADPAQVTTLPTGSPIVLRGTHWPETPFAGLVHRSPPIAGTGETRLLLVLDPVAGPDM